MRSFTTATRPRLLFHEQCQGRVIPLLFLSFWAAPLLAQSPQGDGGVAPGQPGEPTPPGETRESDDAAPTVVPPKLLREEPVSAPSGLTQPAVVHLQLTVDEAGKVTSVTNLGSDSQELERLAMDAARRFEFSPALRIAGDGVGVPVAVVITYDYWFVPPPPESEQPPTPLATPGPEEQSAAPPSDVQLPVMNAPKVNNDRAEESDVYEATATVAAPAREPTKRRMERQELTRVAGTRGDPIRAIEIMPGVGQTNGDAPIIRGASGFESAFFLDGSPVPFLYHFGGLTSFVHPRLVDHVELYPGNFSARYGRVTGGIVETGLRKPSDQFGFIADANLIDSSLLVEGPVTDGLTVAAAARRSNMDLVFDTFVPEGTFSTVAAPVYYDYQGIVHYETPNAEFRIAAFGSRDSLRLMFSEPSELDPNFRGKVQAAIEFHRVQLRHKVRLGNVRQSLQLGLGTQALSQELGALATAYFDIYEVDARGEWDWRVNEAFQLIAGFDTTGQRLVGAYRGPVATTLEGANFAGPVEQVVVDKRTIALFNPALYLEARVSVLPRWQLLPGVRLDYYYQIGETSLNPRLSQRVLVGDRTTVKAGLGLYTQAPAYYEGFAPIGNPDIEPYHSVHSSLGLEHRFFEGLNVDVEGFHKHLYNRIVNTPNGEPPVFINDGIGRIYGVEMGATYHSNFGLTAQLSYTLSKSERRDREEAWRRFDQDQPHILNAAGTMELGSGWELGTRFRYVSGNPSTRIIGAVYDGNRDVYLPQFAGTNADRDPAFHQLDVRGQKTFRIGGGSLSVYLDVQNVYNSANPRGYTYSYDYSEREAAASSFLFPNLGIRGQL